MATRDVNLIIRAKNDASGAFKQVGSALSDLLGIEKRVAQEAEQVRKAMSGSEAEAASLASTLRNQTSRAAQQTGSAFEAIESKVRGAQASFDRQADKLNELSATYDNLEAQVRGAARAVEIAQRAVNANPGDERLAERLRLAVDGYQDLVQAASRAQTEFQEQSNIVRELGVETEQLSRRFESARIAMDSATRAAQQKGAASRSASDGIRRLAFAEQRIAQTSQAASTSTGQLVVALLRAGPAADAAARGMLAAGASALNMRTAFAAFYGDSRRALSLMQRLRGEVLSLTASLVGFYAVLNSGRSVFNAFSEFQAAQNRLGAAFQQNTQLVGRELAFLQGEAERLGITFENLSANYSKFLISAQAANFTTMETRTIFRQVAEAGRVLNLSNDQISGVLTALTQIAGKGTLQMEELRQQLGDRLPGAVAIMARALGYANDELDQFYDDVENGNIDARTALVAFGQELEETYGGQLTEALQSVTAEMGRFQDAIFNRQLSAANAGFIEGLRDALASLTQYLNSREGVEFFEALGAAAGRLMQIVPFIVQNFDWITTFFQIWASIKIAQVFSGLVVNMRGASAAATSFRLAVRQMDRQIILAGRSSAALGARLRMLRPVMIGVASTARAMWVAIGGPIGLIVTAFSFLAVEVMGGLLTSVDEVDAALRRHEELIGDIQAAYLRAASGASDWMDELDRFSLSELRREIDATIERIDAARQSYSNGNGRDPLVQLLPQEFASVRLTRDPEQRAALDEFLRVSRELAQGTAGPREYLAVLEELERVFPDLTGRARDFIIAEQNLANRMLEDAAIVEELEAATTVLRLEREALTRELTEAEQAQLDAARTLLNLTEETEDQGNAAGDAADANEAFATALRELARNVPSLNREIERFDAIAQIEEDFQNALTAARALPDEIMRIAGTLDALAAREGALTGLFQSLGDGLIGDFGLGGGTGATAAARLIQEFEGFASAAYADTRTSTGEFDAFRVGYGSDTITLADGRVVRVTEDTAGITREDAARDLTRRLRDEFLPGARDAIGASIFDSLSGAQQGVLGSLAYNYGAAAFDEGEALAHITRALQSGASQDDVAELIRNLSANPERRAQEALVFQAGRNPGDADEAALEAEEERARLEQERLDREREFHEQQEAELALMQFQLDTEQLALQDREVARALHEAELEAQRAGTQLTQEQREEIERITRARFAEQAAEEHRQSLLEQGQAKEEEINRLRERRNDLIEQERELAERGDLLGAARVAEELDGVNRELEEAIANAIRFWEAMGGPEAEQAIHQLQRVQTELEQTDQQVVVTGRQVNEMFAQKGSQAISTFLQKVAAGEPVMASLGAAFSQMAAEILIELGQMIVKQAIFNAISGLFGGGAGGNGGLGGIIAGGINGLFQHTGGLVGDGTARSATVPVAAFRNAVRYHTGGMAGLASDEYATILQKNEEVLTTGNPRHIFNQGKGGDGARPSVKIVNAFSESEVLSEALNTTEGEESFMNFVRANSSSIRAALGD